MKTDEIVQQLEALRVFPVVVIHDAGQAKALAGALMQGGLPCAEVTFRTAAAADALRAMAGIPGLLRGAGTILTVDQAKQAVDSGAQFLVSPGFNPKVVTYCVSQQIPIFPGVATPTEIEMALDHGLTVVKFFPAEAFGGVKTLKAVAAPYGMTRFIPTGGITAKNLADYLAMPQVLACGASWMVESTLIESGNFTEITRRTREAVDAVKALEKSQ
jgi:2-dehydro-3-deoxyphosphogluconate aldolase/(4S)-4-hydroxy-2-oxoglutarate aldolase